jgi:tetratricopeptide (TPR) repeat protein
MMMGTAARAFLQGVISLILFEAAIWGQSINTPLAERYAQEGQEALAAGHYVEAQAAYEKLRQLEPDVAEIHANLGLIYFQERKFDQAVFSLRQALRLKPSLTKTDSILAISLSEQGRFSDALPGLERGFHRPSDPEMRRMCGLQLQRAYAGMNRDQKAVEIALELNGLYPNDPEILYHSGKIFGNSAFLAMQKLAQVAPASIWRHQAWAEAYESQGSYDVAIGEYRQVLAGDPTRIGIHYRLGRTLLSRSRQTTSAEDAAAALKEFQQELERDPSNASAAYEIAEADRNAGQLEEAQKFFELALEYYPEFEEARLGLGAALTSLQKPAEALPHLQKAISLNRQNEVGWYRLSQVEGMLGNAVERQRAFTEFQRLRIEKSSREEAGKGLVSPEEVTKQQVDPGAPK